MTWDREAFRDVSFWHCMFELIAYVRTDFPDGGELMRWAGGNSRSVLICSAVQEQGTRLPALVSELGEFEVATVGQDLLSILVVEKQSSGGGKRRDHRVQWLNKYCLM